jgi:hypothetical protein
MIRKWIIILGLAILLAVLFRGIMDKVNKSGLASASYLSEKPVIYPDYTNTVIPANIAPLNFRIESKGSRFFVRIHSKNGKPIEILSNRAEIFIPLRKWRNLLEINSGNEMFFDIFVKHQSQWKQFGSITNKIAREPIDSHIAYRMLTPQYNYFKDLGVYQRNLENFDETLLLHGENFSDGCVNCHTFANNDPSEMLIGIRSKEYGIGTLFARDGDVTKIDTKFGHTAWHPSKKMVAYSIYDVRMFYHTERKEVRDVIEFDSLLGYYLIDKQKASTVPSLSDKEQLETQPTWSPDGKYLYFVSAPKLWSSPKFPPDRFAEVKYDLKRISFDLETDTWGQLETVLSSKETGLSILTPKISPDGKFLAFTMCDYSCFALYRPNSDLYMMNLETGSYQKLSCNSEYADSWHSWSSNGRWMVFSTKRDTGIFTRLFITYVDESGKSGKPFVMPQKDPSFYDSFLKAYNVPELITGPVKVSRGALTRAVRNPTKIDVASVTKATPKSKNTAGNTDRWQKRIE